MENESEENIYGKIAEYIIKNNMIRTCQITELSLFVFTGLLMRTDFIASSITLIGGVFFAVATGEAMVRKAKREVETNGG